MKDHVLKELQYNRHDGLTFKLYEGKKATGELHLALAEDVPLQCRVRLDDSNSCVVDLAAKGKATTLSMTSVAPDQIRKLVHQAALSLIGPDNPTPPHPNAAWFTDVAAQVPEDVGLQIICTHTIGKCVIGALRFMMNHMDGASPVELGFLVSYSNGKWYLSIDDRRGAAVSSLDDIVDVAFVMLDRLRPGSHDHILVLVDPDDANVKYFPMHRRTRLSRAAIRANGLFLSGVSMSDAEQKAADAFHELLFSDNRPPLPQLSTPLHTTASGTVITQFGL